MPAPSFVHPELDAVAIGGAWLTPAAAVQGIADGSLYFGNVSQVRWADGLTSWAIAFQADRGVPFRIEAGAYGGLTVLCGGASS